jgi:molybdopterin synthase catalytic subunit/molybdopterin converting factor small subunit
MSPTREISVLLFASLRQRVGRNEVRVTLPPETVPALTVAQLLTLVAAQFPELGPELAHVRIAIDHEFASDVHTAVPLQAEVALIPPVSGGSSIRERGRWSFLTDAPLSLDEVLQVVEHEDAGGVVSFVGRVRRHSRGAEIVFLDYEAYAPMALAKMDAIVDDLRARDPELRAAIGHRVGRLVVGEVAVVIAVGTPHRAEAFAACREIIERLKAEVPIWKREVGSNGESWIGQGP